MAHREELARQMLELTDEQDWFAREALLTEDCEVLTPAGLLRGRAATTAYSRPLVGAFSEARHLLDFVATAGDVVVVEGHWVGRHTGPLATPDGDVPPTGKSLRLPFVATVRVCDDLVSSVHIYSTS